MKNICFSFCIANLLCACGPSSVQSTKVIPAEGESISIEKMHQNYSLLLPLSSAEKVMGEKAYVMDSSTTVSRDASRFYEGFSGFGKDEKTGNAGKFYFLMEEYKSEEGAKKRYAGTFNGNKDHQGVKVANDLGDEAYFHGDGSSFFFVMVRKGNKVFDLKVNKVTSKTSQEEFNKLAKEIADKI